ncbi:hypothetical protein E3N88_00028 [Mikania micrantha]|uniref:UDP-3-O-[3-hydroxymyristoyl] glucosamine N-acyltransferase non-repeat region domain-containing protein n=1 Tax=Mikania micrantha TaxID=192012 RepID=A0A5N6PXD1_9ASTR|nr:hypothetical protein E3N88_00028 [Mikania micrantha]
MPLNLNFDGALTHICFTGYAYNPRVEDVDELLKWHKGGGMFHKSASIDPTALIDFGAVVHSGSSVGGNVHVGSGTVVGPNVTIGKSTKIGYNVALANCTIGDSCVIHHGVCIGQDGFGFFINEDGAMVKKPQALKAHIGNHVEIGANTCIDRGSWRDTVIGDHSKIDNLVQIGHNAVIGKCCLLCGQVGIAGSVTMGDYVTLGGRAGVRDHVTIVSKVRLAAASCVTKDIFKPGDYGGFPAMAKELDTTEQERERSVSPATSPHTNRAPRNRDLPQRRRTPTPSFVYTHHRRTQMHRRRDIIGRPGAAIRSGYREETRMKEERT